jgi:preprotein translocase subunit SecY
MSFVDLLKPIFKFIPEVQTPAEKPSLNSKLKWTGLVLLVFFILGQIKVLGLSAANAAEFSRLQVLLASSIGTLLTTGIGPIVVASIILQLLIGSGILKIDFSTPEGRVIYSNLQKILGVLLAFFEAYIFVSVGMLEPLPGMFFLVVLQVAAGSIILMYLDEVVQKYGIGSGISLFIAGGVASSIMWRVFSPISPTGSGLQFFATGAGFDIANPSGLLWIFFNQMGSNFLNAFIQNILPILFAVIIFLIVVYFEGIHVNVPLTLGRAGQFGRFPVKFLYVSNIPVILSVALFANISLIYSLVKDSAIPVLTPVLSYISHFTTAPYGLIENILLQGGFAGYWGQILQGFVYIILLMLCCVFFGKMWVQMANQDSASVAQQLQKSGMFLPGFRRDPRVIKTVLDRYIPTITILGALFVGFLAGFASLTGAVGTGMGILLTVDIVYRFYETLAKEQVQDHRVLSKLMAGMKR